MLVRSQATNQRPADRTSRTRDQNSHRASLSARFVATRSEAHVKLSQKALLSCYDEFKNSTAHALAWRSKVQIIKIGSRQSVQPPVSAPRSCPIAI
jgi:hypothetical protein